MQVLLEVHPRYIVLIQGGQRRRKQACNSKCKGKYYCQPHPTLRLSLNLEPLRALKSHRKVSYIWVRNSAIHPHCKIYILSGLSICFFESDDSSTRMFCCVCFSFESGLVSRLLSEVAGQTLESLSKEVAFQAWYNLEQSRA